MNTSTASVPRSRRLPAGPMLRYLSAAALARLADEGSRVALLLALGQPGGAAYGGLLVVEALRPAARLGMTTVHFRDSAQVRQELRRLGVLRS